MTVKITCYLDRISDAKGIKALVCTIPTKAEADTIMSSKKIEKHLSGNKLRIIFSNEK